MGAAVPQARLALLAEALGDPVDGSTVDLEELGNEGRGAAGVAEAGAGVAAVGEVLA